MDLNSILLSPVITEKSMQAAAHQKYTFMVHLRAEKGAIKKTVEKKFNVHVLSISTTTLKGRTIKTGTRRVEVILSPTKKAIVQIKSGEKIALFDIKA